MDEYSRASGHGHNFSLHDQRNCQQHRVENNFSRRNCRSASEAHRKVAAQTKCIPSFGCRCGPPSGARSGNCCFARRTTRASPRRSADDQELHRRRRLALPRWFSSPKSLCASPRRPARHPLEGAARDPPPKYEHARISHGLRNRQSSCWENEQPVGFAALGRPPRSEEHTSELQSHLNLVCRLLLEKKKPTQTPPLQPPLLPRPVFTRTP